ncbi:MAG: histidine kinase [Bacteroidetes bacterium]|nr:histidine kinase [Bacteroidota bacterium]MBT7493098.1 histidine kinase [Bacteroidota bacterium]
MNKKVFWKTNLAIRFFIEFVFFNLIAILIIAILLFAYAKFFVSHSSVSVFYEDHSDTFIKLNIITFVLVFIFTIVDFMNYSYSKYASIQVENVKLASEQLKLQFDALKSQLNPHYLFNSLNTISSLIYRDIELAEKFVRRFSQTYQYILSVNERKLVSLSEELEVSKAYAFLLKVRYENSLEMNINLPENIMNSKIPPLSLQMLIENSVKHNVISEEMPLKIEIYLDKNDYLVVINNFIGKPNYVEVENNLMKKPEKNNFKIGLENIKKRYNYFTNRKIFVQKDENFTVRLPIII